MPEDLLDEIAEQEDDLEHSRGMYLYLVTKNRHLLHGCNTILEDCYSANEIKTRPKKEAARRVVRMLVIALYKEWEHDPSKFLTISLNHNDWSVTGRYSALRLSAYQLSRAIHKLHDQGYIDLHLGKFNPKQEEQRQTRFRAKSKLVQTMYLNAESQNIEHLIKSDLKRFQVSLDRPRIQLKNEDKIIIKPIRTPSHVIESERLLERYQQLLDRTEIIHPVTGEILTPYDKFQYRVFSRSSFDYNGRVHGGFWQHIDSELRPLIKLDGEATVERDVKGTFPVMVYHALGIDYWRVFADNQQENIPTADPYYLQGYTDRQDFGKDFRNILKMVFNSAINTTNNGENLGWITRLIREEKLPQMLKHYPPRITQEAADIIGKQAPQFIKKFLFERHHLIRDYLFYEENGLRAMNMESEVLLKVIDKFENLNKPILTVYDSFIVKTEDETLLTESIVNSYWNTFGFTPYLT